MKKLILLLLITLSFTSSKAQNYYPFPTNYGIWMYEYIDEMGVSYGLTLIIELNGDTVLNGISYQKLNHWDYNNGVFYGPYYYGGLREANKQIFIFPDTAIAERLFYDFNLLPGDTFPENHCNYSGMPAIVDTIIPVTYPNGVVYNALVFNFVYGLWYPGIGINSGPLYCPDTPVSLSGYYLLHCMAGDSGILYGNPNQSCALGIANINTRENNISIFPNPASDYFTFAKDLPAKNAIKIYDAFGREVSAIKNIKANERIDVSFLPKGVYVVEIETGSGRNFQKLLKH